jgi:methyl-accepting chemotaxis protein
MGTFIPHRFRIMTLKQKIFWYGVSSVLAAVLLGGLGLFGQTTLARAMHANEIGATALRNHV